MHFYKTVAVNTPCGDHAEFLKTIGSYLGHKTGKTSVFEPLPLHDTVPLTKSHDHRNRAVNPGLKVMNLDNFTRNLSGIR